MSNVSGVVVDVGTASANTRFGVKTTYHIVLDNGDTFKCGFKKPPVSRGDNVTFNFTTGKYGNEADVGTIRITGATATPAANSSTAAATSSYSNGRGGFRPFPIPPDHGDRAIVRQNALTNAREAVESFYNPESLDEAINKIIEVAYKFEEYTSGQREVNAADEIMKAGKA